MCRTAGRLRCPNRRGPLSIWTLVPAMPFNLRFASSDKRRLSQHAVKAKVAPQALREFCLGVSFGLGLIAALIATYWLIVTYGGGLPAWLGG